MRLLYYLLGLFLVASSGIVYIVYNQYERPEEVHHSEALSGSETITQESGVSAQQHEEKKEEGVSTHQTVDTKHEQASAHSQAPSHYQAQGHTKAGCGCHKESTAKKTEKNAPVQQSTTKKVDTKNQTAQKPAEKQKKRTEKSEHAKQAEITLPIKDSFRPKERHQPGTLGYKHWTGWYYPSKFILSINGLEILSFDGHEFKRMRTELTFNPNEPLKTGFVWEFLGGRKAGWRNTDFMLDPTAESIDIGFDWKDQWQVKIDKAQVIPESDRSSDNRNVTKR